MISAMKIGVMNSTFLHWVTMRNHDDITEVHSIATKEDRTGVEKAFYREIKELILSPHWRGFNTVKEVESYSILLEFFCKHNENRMHK